MAESDLMLMTERLDEMQIVNADKAVKEAFVYIHRKSGKKVLSYGGIKHLVLQMSYKGEAMEILEYEVHLDKYDPEDLSKWWWVSTVRMQNKLTGYQGLGASSAPFVERTREDTMGRSGIMDPFGRTKALSKADRNAARKQIPETKIHALLNEAQGEQVQVVGDGKEAPKVAAQAQPKAVAQAAPKPVAKAPPQPVQSQQQYSSAEDEPPTEGQMRVLNGNWHPWWTGPMPVTKAEAIVVVGEIMDEQNRRKAAVAEAHSNL